VFGALLTGCYCSLIACADCLMAGLAGRVWEGVLHACSSVCGNLIRLDMLTQLGSLQQGHLSAATIEACLFSCAGTAVHSTVIHASHHQVR
jgi:hypothetical protein